MFCNYGPFNPFYMYPRENILKNFDVYLDINGGILKINFFNLRKIRNLCIFSTEQT